MRLGLAGPPGFRSPILRCCRSSSYARTLCLGGLLLSASHGPWAHNAGTREIGLADHAGIRASQPKNESSVTNE
jgi:hypothetical protein